VPRRVVTARDRSSDSAAYQPNNWTVPSDSGTTGEHRASVVPERPSHELRPSKNRRERMTWIIIIIVGGILGWLASLIMRTDAQQGIILNIVVGIVGAVLGGLLLSPFLGGGSITSGNFSLPNILISLVGAIILLAIVNLIRRGTVR
jgi:uncharacterized membrane protein YeaQ/YmgE (transglycosylase-associated protein family)